MFNNSYLCKILNRAINLKNKVSFLTTIFSNNSEYLNDFDSLKNQTFKDFDVIVVNDGYEKFDVIKKYEQYQILLK